MPSVEERLARLEERSDTQGRVLDRIDKNVASLMESRTYVRGLGQGVAWILGIPSAIASIVAALVAYLLGGE